jgi:hypothetical protein
MFSPLAYVPFRDPLWGAWDYWYLFAIPLAVLLAVAWKGIRIEKIQELPRAAARWAGLLLASMVGLAVLLWIIVWIANATAA